LKNDCGRTGSVFAFRAINVSVRVQEANSIHPRRRAIHVNGH
jgi:hypothetical protein